MTADGDCEHDWALAEVGMRGGLLDTSSTCVRCGAVRYEPAGDPKARPPLDGV